MTRPRKFWSDAVPISRMRRPKYKSLLIKCAEVSRTSTSANKLSRHGFSRPEFLSSQSLLAKYVRPKVIGFPQRLTRNFFFAGSVGYCRIHKATLHPRRDLQATCPSEVAPTSLSSEGIKLLLGSESLVCCISQ